MTKNILVQCLTKKNATVSFTELYEDKLHDESL